MIVLDMNENVRFGGADKWPLLFAVADVFRRFSSAKRPLSVNDVSELLNKEYGIEKIDRHAVRDYRERLEQYFKYNFVEVKKKGYYLASVDYTLGDDDLAAIAIMVQSSLSFSKEGKQITLENLAHYSGSDRMREVIENISTIEAIGSNPDMTENTATLIQGLLKTIRRETTIVLRYPEKTKSRNVIQVYPQCIFFKNNEFYLLGVRYQKKPNCFLSYAYLYKIKNIISFKIKDKNKIDLYQAEKGFITNYAYKKEPKVYPLKDYVSMLGDTKEGIVSFSRFDRIETAKILIKGSNNDRLMNTIDYLENKYGDRFAITKFVEEERSSERKIIRKAIATLTLPMEEVISAVFCNSRNVTLLGPQRIIRKYKSSLLQEYEAYPKKEDK